MSDELEYIRTNSSGESTIVDAVTLISGKALLMASENERSPSPEERFYMMRFAA
jgi:hypothetical protein